MAPGQTYIEVEYDYDYKFKDRLITIKQGECYLLIKKSNEDWWQVRKDENSKPFYVPAQYVREVRRALMPPSKPLPHTVPGAGARGGTIRPSALEIQRSDDNKKSPCPSPSAGHTALLPPRDDKGCPSSPTSLIPHAQTNTSQGSLPRTRAESPSRKANGEKDKSKELEKRERGVEQLAGDSDRNRNDSESGEELSSSSNDNLQVRLTEYSK